MAVAKHCLRAVRVVEVTPPAFWGVLSLVTVNAVSSTL